jgi:hypothetical protein
VENQASYIDRSARLHSWLFSIFACLWCIGSIQLLQRSVPAGIPSAPNQFLNEVEFGGYALIAAGVAAWRAQAMGLSTPTWVGVAGILTAPLFGAAVSARWLLSQLFSTVLPTTASGSPLFELVTATLLLWVYVSALAVLFCLLGAGVFSGLLWVLPTVRRFVERSFQQR